jgi:hypothetical protein
MPLPHRCCILLGVLLAGCRSSEFDYGELPELVRIVTDPPAADVQLEGSLARFVTPCDIRREALEGRTLLIEKPGYVPFRGTLADIPAGERGTFKLTLRPQ